MTIFIVFYPNWLKSCRFLRSWFPTKQRKNPPVFFFILNIRSWCNLKQVASKSKCLILKRALEHILMIYLISRINGETLSSFPNLKLGTGILQQTLTTLLQYYHRYPFMFVNWQLYSCTITGTHWQPHEKSDYPVYQYIVIFLDEFRMPKVPTLTALVALFHDIRSYNNQILFRFTRLMSVAPLSQIPAVANLINIHQLMVEVKKYKPNF